MIKRTLALLALAALAIVPAALAGVKAGSYTGTTSHKNPLTIVVASSGTSGLFKFCGDSKGVAFKIAPTGTFSVVGKTFGNVTLQASGKFAGSKVTGKITQVVVCDGAAQTFALAAK